MNKAEKIIHALKEHLNIKSDKALAEFFGLDVKNIYSWKKNGNITNTLRIYDKLRYLNIDWLETFTGPMMIIDKDNIHLIPQRPNTDTNGYIRPNIVARIEPGSPEITKILQGAKDIEKKATDIEKPPSVEEMVDMTKVVLNSQTVYRSALASNVRAFYQAVKNEGELKMLSDEIAEIRQANREMKESQKRIEEMLRSLGAVEQKRDSAA